MASQRYSDLTQRVQQLETHLLPVVDPSLSYSDKDRDLVRAFCLLCHAEIEAYLEDIVWETTTKAFNIWYANKAVVSTIIFHLAHSHRHESGKPKDQPYSMIVKSYKSLETTIKKNHGIKEDNLNNILNPIGFEIDSILKTTLNDFGKTRGQIAHTSFKIQQPLDPVTERNKIRQIVQALAIFDNDLDTYQSSGSQSRVTIISTWYQRISLKLIRMFS
jgi:hypothetical protein